MVASMNLVLNVILHVHFLYVDVSTKVISVYTSESMKESILSLEDGFSSSMPTTAGRTGCDTTRNAKESTCTRIRFHHRV